MSAIAAEAETDFAVAPTGQAGGDNGNVESMVEEDACPDIEVAIGYSVPEAWAIVPYPRPPSPTADKSCGGKCSRSYKWRWEARVQLF